MAEILKVNRIWINMILMYIFLWEIIMIDTFSFLLLLPLTVPISSEPKHSKWEKQKEYISVGIWIKSINDNLYEIKSQRYKIYKKRGVFQGIVDINIP